MDGSVTTGGGEAPAVGAERHADDAVVTHEFVEELPSGHVINSHVAVRPRTSDGQTTPIWTNGYAPNARGKVAQRPRLVRHAPLGIAQVPDIDHAIPACGDQATSVRSE